MKLGDFRTVPLTPRGFQYRQEVVLARRSRRVALSFFVQAPQKFLEFRFLLGSQDGADLVAPFLPRLLHLRIGLVVDRFILRVKLRKGAIELLPLIVGQAQVLRELLDSLRAPLRFA